MTFKKLPLIHWLFFLLHMIFLPSSNAAKILSDFMILIDSTFNPQSLSSLTFSQTTFFTWSHQQHILTYHKKWLSFLSHFFKHSVLHAYSNMPVMFSLIFLPIHLSFTFFFFLHEFFIFQDTLCHLLLI